MKKRNDSFGKLTAAACLSAVLVISVLSKSSICVSAEQPDLTGSPSLSWELPPAQDLPAGEKNAAVHYRIVHETVYAACPLYVRTGPGSQYDLIGKLSKGEVVRRGAVGNNGWSQILYGGREAYVNSTHLSVSPILPDLQVPDPHTVYTETNDFVRAITITKLRSGPGSHYAVIGHLTRGSGAVRMSYGSNGWSKLMFHDTTAYACTGDLSSQTLELEPQWSKTNDHVSAAAGIALWSGPSHNSRILTYLSPGDITDREAVSSGGWSQLRWNNQTGYACTAYLSEDLQIQLPAVETSKAELPTPNAPFIYQYMAPEGIMPHALFTPADGDLSKPLPLLISLHGALEIGEAPNTLKHNFITKEFLNWEYTGLQGFDAYIVCPQLTGCGYASTWRCPESADNLFSLIEHLKRTCNIDENRIMIEGHSLGGEGVLYMAADPRACFSAVVPISAYHPYVDFNLIHTSVRGYNGSPYLPSPREDWDSYNFMQNIFENYFGIQNWFTRNCSHYDIPMVAFEEDLDHNGKSDLIEWMLAQ